jgi:putative transposase
MNEYERRKEAIRRVLAGETVSTVCHDLQRSRTWYYKWYHRYAQAGAAGLKDQRPGHPPPEKTSPEVRELVRAIRERLVRQAKAGQHHLGIGGKQIQHELRELGAPVVSISTIYRILRQAGKIATERKPHGWCPRPTATQTNQVQQLDLWPRVLGGGTYLYIVHIVDVANWYVWGRVLSDKRTDTLMRFLVTTWQHSGVPQYLQLDNEMSFTGGRWFSRLGRFIRLGLLLGTEVWFNPFRHSRAQCLRGTLSRPM